MSRKPSKRARTVVARRVGVAFKKLSPPERRRFADETLTVLINNPKQVTKLFERLIKRGRPRKKDMAIMNQLIIVFLYTLKPEFMYHYASMIYKRFKEAAGIPIPKELPKKIEEVREKEFIHAGVSPETFNNLYALWEKMGSPMLPNGLPDYDTFFSNLLLNAETKAQTIEWETDEEALNALKKLAKTKEN